MIGPDETTYMDYIDRRTKPMKKITTILVTLIGLAVAGLILTPTTASPAEAATSAAHRLEPPVRHVKHVKVSYVHKSASDPKWIEFNTGSLWSVRACKYEYSNNCYWSARKQGNGKGKSFVTLHGKTYYTTLL